MQYAVGVEGRVGCGLRVQSSTGGASGYLRSTATSAGIGRVHQGNFAGRSPLNASGPESAAVDGELRSAEW